MGEPFAEHRLGIHHLGEAGLVDLHGRDDRRRPRLGLAITHAVIGILERKADELFQPRRNQIVLAAQFVPRRDPFRIFLRQRQRHRLAGLHVERIRNRRPDILPGEDVAIGDVEGFVARRRCFARPGDGTRQQIDVDRLRHPRGAAGIIERAALLAQHRRIDAERRDQIHGAADRFADDQDRAKNAPVPGLALLQFAQKILLRPVEIRLLVHFRAALARRHRERADVDAIGLGALQQRDMAERRRNRLERRHQIAQHQVVGSDLVWIAPAVDQVRRFIERGIDEMGCILQRSCGLRALRRIGQVDRHVAGAVELARLAPRQRDNFAAAGSAEVPQCGISDQPCRARDHHFLVCHWTTPAPIAAFTSRRAASDVSRRLSLSSGPIRAPLSIQAALRNCGGTRTLDYRSPIRHPARRSIKPGIAYRKTKSLGFRAHISNTSPAPTIGKPERRHKTVVPWSGIGKNRGEAKHETS